MYSAIAEGGKTASRWLEKDEQSAITTQPFLREKKESIGRKKNTTITTSRQKVKEGEGVPYRRGGR